MDSSAKSEGAGLVERTGETRLWDSRDWGMFLDFGEEEQVGWGDGEGGLSGTPRLWLFGRRCLSQRREQTGGNLKETRTLAQISITEGSGDYLNYLDSGESNSRALQTRLNL